MATLEPWVLNITPETAAATPDPIRTRMFFLKFVDAKRRPGVIRSAIDSTESALQLAEQRRLVRPHRPAPDLRYLASEGVMFELRARVDWLKWLQSEFSKGSALSGAVAEQRGV